MCQTFNSRNEGVRREGGGVTQKNELSAHCPYCQVDPADVELDFEEFQECLCRAANLINPEEYLRLSIKVRLRARGL